MKLATPVPTANAITGHTVLAAFGRTDSASWLKQHVPSADLNEGSDASGGYVAATPTHDRLVQTLGDFSACAKLCNVVMQDGKTVTVPRFAGTPTVVLADEAGNLIPHADDFSFGSNTLQAMKRSVAIEVSEELLDDSAPNIGRAINEQLAMLFGKRLDEDWINGDGSAGSAGSAGYGGINGLDASLGDGGSIAAANAWSSFTTAHLAACVAALSEKYHERAAWLMSRSFFASVVQRLLGAGNSTLGPDGRHYLLGYPIAFSEACPTSDANSTVACYFGDFKATCDVALSPLRIAASRHAKFGMHQVVIRATQRWDIAVHDAGTHTTAGGYVGLRETS